MFLRVENRVPDFEGRFEDLEPGDVSLNIFCGVEARRAEFGEGVDELRIGDLFFGESLADMSLVALILRSVRRIEKWRDEGGEMFEGRGAGAWRKHSDNERH